MSQSYNPGASERDRVRLRIDDKVAGAMILVDEEIDDLLAQFSYNEACAQACESIALYFAKKADEIQEGDERRKFLARVSTYRQMAKQIREAGHQPDGPPRTGAATAQMQAPDLSQYRTD